MTLEELKHARELGWDIENLKRRIEDIKAYPGQWDDKLTPATILRIQALMIEDLSNQLFEKQTLFAALSVQPSPPPAKNV